MLCGRRLRLVNINIQIRKAAEMLLDEGSNVFPAQTAIPATESRHREALNTHVLIIFGEIFQTLFDIVDSRVLAPIPFRWKVQNLNAVIFPEIRFTRSHLAAVATEPVFFIERGGTDA